MKTGYLRILKSGQVRIDRTAIREAEKYDGNWVIETNDDTISLEDVACGYKGLMVIECCLRFLKRTHIKITPMYHWFSRRLDGWVVGALINHNAPRILTWSVDGTACLWDVENGTPIGQPMKDGRYFFGAVFNREGIRVLTWSGDETARLWDAID